MDLVQLVLPVSEAQSYLQKPECVMLGVIHKGMAEVGPLQVVGAFYYPSGFEEDCNPPILGRCQS